MHEASASALDDWGEDTLSPSPPPSPLLSSINNHKRSSVPKNTTDKSILISIPATQFELFQRSMQDSNVPTMAASGNQVIATDPLPRGNAKDTVITPIHDQTVMSVSDSSNVSYQKNSLTSTRPQLPILVNTNVKDLNDSRMEIDSDVFRRVFNL